MNKAVQIIPLYTYLHSPISQSYYILAYSRNNVTAFQISPTLEIAQNNKKINDNGDHELRTSKHPANDNNNSITPFIDIGRGRDLIRPIEISVDCEHILLA